MNKKTKTIAILSVSVVVIILILLPKFGSSKKDGAGGGFGNRNASLAIDAYIIKPEELNNNVLTSGTILANEEVELKSEVAGKITKILFKEGSRVKKGDLLIKTNDADLQAQLEKAKFVYKLSQEKEYRQRNLLKRQAISQEEYDSALNEMNVNKAQIDLIKAEIAKTEITAPFDGRIGLRQVSVGSYITPSTEIASLQNIDPVKIDFSVPEKYASTVEVGDKIHFNIVGTEKTYTGSIYAIEPKIDNVTRTLKLRALCPNRDGRLLPGGYADVKLVLKNIDNALMVPSESIIPILKGQVVYLYKSGKVVSQKVETGIRTDSTIQITEGLQPQDTLITSGILQLRPGSSVSISKLN